MYIGLFANVKEPDSSTSYRGLYRSSPLPSGYAQVLMDNHDHPLFYLWDWYVELDYCEHHITYSEQNMCNIRQMHRLASGLGITQDAILFGDLTQLDHDAIRRENATFIGYDVCGDGMFYSLLGTSLFGANSVVRVTPMAKILQAYFMPRLNANVLLSCLEDAELLAAVLEKLSECGYAEDEPNWRPFAIYSVSL